MPPGALVVVCGVTGAGKSSLLAALLGEITMLEEDDARGEGEGPPLLRSPRVAVGGRASVHGAEAVADERDDQGEHPVRATARRAVVRGRRRRVRAARRPAAAARGRRDRGRREGHHAQRRPAAAHRAARATYARADVYLLDDPLSAVDAHVGKHLFERCVRGTLGAELGATRVLVTHQLDLAIAHADLIVVLDKTGAIVESGAAAELLDDASKAPHLHKLLGERGDGDSSGDELEELAGVEAKDDAQGADKAQDSGKAGGKAGEKRRTRL